MMILHRHQWSLPITLKRLTYQRCLLCGARRMFDRERWRHGKLLGREIAHTESARHVA